MKMLVSEKERIGAEEALSHPFITENQSKKTSNRKQSYFSYIHNLRNYMNYSHMKKIILTSIASRTNFSDLYFLQEIFNSLDTNKDGSISYIEFENGLKNFFNKKLTLKESYFDDNIDINELFQSIDTDNSKKIDYTEFVAAAMDRKFFEDKNKLLETFQILDTDKDGKLDYNEFEEILHLHGKRTEKDIEIIKLLREEFDSFDLNKDGKIDYNDFLDIVISKKEKIYPKRKDKI